MTPFTSTRGHFKLAHLCRVSHAVRQPPRLAGAFGVVQGHVSVLSVTVQRLLTAYRRLILPDRSGGTRCEVVRYLWRTSALQAKFFPVKPQGRGRPVPRRDGGLPDIAHDCKRGRRRFLRQQTASMGDLLAWHTKSLERSHISK
jgi:hypothetical protein